MTIEENVILKSFTTFKIGGAAQFFRIAQTIEDLQQAVDFAHSKQLAIFVLGGGSNVLVSDNGFNGLVIKVEVKGIEINHTEVIAGAGENWDEFVACTVDKGLYGLENLSLIPGNIGAAPVQNIGAYGVEVKDTLSWVEAFDVKTQEIKRFSNAECEFKYRDSIFKNQNIKNI